jgi:hypothetical protein
MAPTYRTLVVLAQTKTTLLTNAQISSQAAYIITLSITRSLAVDASRWYCMLQPQIPTGFLCPELAQPQRQGLVREWPFAFQ